MDNKETKTFETRLRFIESVFKNLKSKDQILASSIEYKLSKSYEEYLEEVKTSIGIIIGNTTDKKAQKVLKKVIKE